ncbi:MAG: amidohydrolase family protein, partial [Gammaproteobacteria bacterium]
RKPPVAALRDAGVPIALATDLNPGSSPLGSLLAAMNMACVLFGLTPAAALAGATVNGARALSLADRGTIEIGKLADLAVWSVESPGELAYALGADPCFAVFKRGELVFPQPVPAAPEPSPLSM